MNAIYHSYVMNCTTKELKSRRPYAAVMDCASSFHTAIGFSMPNNAALKHAVANFNLAESSAQ